MDNQELVDWIAHDQGEYATFIRMVLQDSLRDIINRTTAFEQWARSFDHRHMMRRKIQRMLRNA